MSSLNDLVTDWAATNADEATYNAGKAGLQALYTFDEIMAAGTGDYNSGLAALASGPLYPAVMDESVLWLDAKYSVTREPRVINQGTGGASLDAKYGSVLGAYVYDGAVENPNGPDNNYLSLTSPSVQAWTGSIELSGRIIRDRSNADGVVISKGLLEAYLYVNSNGTLTVRFKTDAANEIHTTTAAIGVGEWTWVKAVCDLGADEFRIYTAPGGPTTDEPSSWTLIETDAFSTPGTTWVPGANGIGLGAIGGSGGSALDGMRLSRGIWRLGIDGSTAIDVDLTNVADYATSFTATTGQTVTVNSTSSDTNDPLLLTHTGENYVYSPGGAQGGLSTAVTVPAHTTAVLYWHGVPLSDATTRGMVSSVSSNGGFRMISSGATGGIAVHGFTAAGAYAGAVTWAGWFAEHGNQEVHARATCLSNGSVTLETSTDGATWTVRVSSTLATATTGSGATTIGANWRDTAGLNSLESKLYGSYIQYDSDVFWEVDCATDITDAGATSFTATSGQTVTVNRATSGRKTALVTRPIWLFGTDDYLEVADNALLDFGAADEFTALAIVRQFDTAAVSVPVLSKFSPSTGAGWQIRNGGATALLAVSALADGTVSFGVANVTTRTAGQQYGLFLIRDSANLTMNMSNVSTSAADTTTATLANALPVRVGAAAGGTVTYTDAEIVAVAVFRRVLTTDEIAAINTYYGTA